MVGSNSGESAPRPPSPLWISHPLSRPVLSACPAFVKPITRTGPNSNRPRTSTRTFRRVNKRRQPKSLSSILTGQWQFCHHDQYSSRTYVRWFVGVTLTIIRIFWSCCLFIISMIDISAWFAKKKISPWGWVTRHTNGRTRTKGRNRFSLRALCFSPSILISFLRSLSVQSICEVCRFS